MKRTTSRPKGDISSYLDSSASAANQSFHIVLLYCQAFTAHLPALSRCGHKTAMLFDEAHCSLVLERQLNLCLVNHWERPVMIVACIELKPSPGERKAMLEILQFVERGLGNNPACLSCGVYEKLDQNRTILYEEKWESEQSFCNHIRSSSYLALLNAMELAQSKPTISFNKVTSTRSMELIEALRSRETNTEREIIHEDR